MYQVKIVGKTEWITVDAANGYTIHDNGILSFFKNTGSPRPTSQYIASFASGYWLVVANKNELEEGEEEKVDGVSI